MRRPYPAVTVALVAANLVVFAAMAVRGVPWSGPSADDAVRWGANFGPRTLRGEWWRLVTHAFLHLGPLHLAGNMLALAGPGALLERTLGRVAYVTLYVASAVAGGALSVALKPFAVSAGASGAVLGIFGALGALSLLERDTLRGAGVRIGGAFFALLAVNLVPRAGVDSAAHVGGLAAGALGAALLGAGRRARGTVPVRRTAVCAVAFAVLFAALVPRLPDPLARLDEELVRIGHVEDTVYASVRAVLADAAAHRVSEADAAARLERDVLVPWRAEQQRVARLESAPPELQHRVRAMAEYMRLRAEGWQVLAAALRTGDRGEIARAQGMQRQADALAAAFWDRPASQPPARLPR